MKNKESTRYFSDCHEKSVCEVLGGRQVSNSGANRFEKGDVIVNDMLIECKCAMSEKDSVSIKKDWLLKTKIEAFRNRLSDTCLCFNFEPDGDNYYVIDEKLMKVLCNALKESN